MLSHKRINPKYSKHLIEQFQSVAGCEISWLRITKSKCNLNFDFVNVPLSRLEFVFVFSNINCYEKEAGFGSRSAVDSRFFEFFGAEGIWNL